MEAARPQIGRGEMASVCGTPAYHGFEQPSLGGVNSDDGCRLWHRRTGLVGTAHTVTADEHGGLFGNGEGQNVQVHVVGKGALEGGEPLVLTVPDLTVEAVVS